MMTTPITNAFTCTGPYAILILMGLKRVENRSAWPEPVEGRCAMSVSRKFCRGEYDNFMRWLEGHCAPELREIMPKWEDVQDWPGKIVGTIDYRVQRPIDCGPQELAERRMWNEGYDCWWSLADPRVLASPLPVRGYTGFWRLPAATAAALSTAEELSKPRWMNDIEIIEEVR